ncbi:MAG: hypothetical protein FWD15_01225 [Alphaproteobacteria bacterium]|nr:hypothetical protein [Alphaproteobacteria bacterium]
MQIITKKYFGIGAVAKKLVLMESHAMREIGEYLMMRQAVFALPPYNEWYEIILTVRGEANTTIEVCATRDLAPAQRRAVETDAKVMQGIIDHYKNKNNTGKSGR